jgi:hypothetical protein
MTKPYRDFVEKLKTVSQQNELFRNPTELVSYVHEEYAKLSKTRADHKKLLYLIVDNQLQKLKEKYPFRNRHSLQNALIHDLQEVFHIDRFGGSGHDKDILDQGIGEIITNLTDDYYPKLSQEQKDNLSRGLKSYHEGQRYKKEMIAKYGPDHKMFKPIPKTKLNELSDNSKEELK